MIDFRILPALQSHDIPTVVCLVERCVCCWQVAHPNQAYPSAWSSTLCLPHALWTLQRRQAARQAIQEAQK